MGKTTESDIRSAMESLPTGSSAYNKTYENAMERITAQDADGERLAKKVLWWITCAKRPLIIVELQHAIAVKPGKSEFDEKSQPDIEDIVSVCAGLVMVDEESKIIRLVHYTTQEYFERTESRWFPNAQMDITKTCITYLSLRQFESGFCQTDDEFEKRLQLYKLYDYASHNWGHHARAASTLMPEVNSFLERKGQVESSIQALLAVKSYHLEYSQRFPKEMTGLHLAAYFGVEAVIKLLLDKNADLKAADSYGWTPLLWASDRGHVEVVRLLLEKGANVNIAAPYGRTPLLLASDRGHVEVVRLLLEKGADVKTANRDGWTPLLHASEKEHVEVVRLLLEKGANVNIAAPYGRTPLLLASDRGYVEVVRLLLENGADVKAANSSGLMPLYQASEKGHVEVVKLLAAAQKRANVNMANGHVDVVK
jgi:ankyrin repeat protein